MWLIMIILYLVVGLFPQMYTMGLKYIEIDSYRLSYIVLPTICIILLLVFAKFFMEVEPRGKNHDRKLAVLWAFYFAAIIIVINMAAGIFIDELEKNPYDRTISGIISNLYYAVPMILYRENVRSYAINNGKYFKCIFVGLVICTMIVKQNFSEIQLLGGTEETVIYIARYVAPAIVEGIFLNMMAAYGGAGPGIIYLLMMEIMKWIFPVTPMLGWLTEIVISVGIGGIIILMLGDRISECQDKYKKRSHKKKKPEKIFGQITVMGICVLIIWFFAGVFEIYPSVVLTGSMEPGIEPGDMILINKITDKKEIDKLKVGDVITFHRDDIVITHRIIEIVKDENDNISFRTKGDNNSAEDSRLVETKEVMGKYIRVVPKAGLPVLWIKGRGSIPQGVES